MNMRMYHWTTACRASRESASAALCAEVIMKGIYQ
jgi:hypothetical protein